MFQIIHKNLTITFILLCIVTSAYAEEDFGASFFMSNHFDASTGYYNELNAKLSLSVPLFYAEADMSLINDGKYQADVANLASGIY